LLYCGKPIHIGRIAQQQDHPAAAQKGDDETSIREIPARSMGECRSHDGNIQEDAGMIKLSYSVALLFMQGAFHCCIIRESRDAFR
jgi:hypothetical protein